MKTTAVVKCHIFLFPDMRNAPQSLNGRPFQRPEFRGSLADPAITLHDHVMLDDPTAEEKLYEIGAKWEQAHGKECLHFSGEEIGEFGNETRQK